MEGSDSLARLVPDVIRRKHSRKLGVVFALIAVFLVVGGVFIVVQTSGIVSAQTEDRMQYSAEAQARELSRVTNLLRQEARLISRSGKISKAPCPNVKNCNIVDTFIEREVGGNSRLPDEVEGIHYVSTAGDNITASTREGVAGRTFADLNAPWTNDRTNLNEQLEDKSSTYVSEPWNLSVGSGESKRVFAVVSRVPRRDSFVVITFNVERLSNSMPRPSDDGFTTVIDASGTTYLSHRSEQFASSVKQSTYKATVDGSEQSLVGLSTDIEPGYTQARPFGEEMAVGYASVEGTDWVVLTHVPVEKAFAVPSRVQLNLVVLLGGAILALAAVAVAFGRSTARSLGRLAGKANELKEGDLSANLESQRIDEFGQLYEAFDSMREALGERMQEAQKARMEAEQNRKEVQQLNAHLERKAGAYGQVMKTCAEGDLTVRMDPESESEAMSQIATQFNEMIEELEAATARLRDFSTEVATSSEEVTASVEEVRNASEQVSNTIQVISEGADRQNHKFQIVSEEMNELSATTEEIASASNEVASIAERSTELGRQGRQHARDAIDTIETVSEDAESSIEEFERLESEIEEIDELTDTIADIADETNRLALNANIEASRAAGSDSADGGFAAVAEEIREFAADTKEAASEADELIESVLERTDDTADIVKRTGEEVQGSVDTIENVAEALGRLAKHAEVTHDGIEEINDATDTQAESAQQVVALVDEAADISDETAVESESVAAAAQEQTSALTAVSRNVSELAEQANQLSERLDSFSTRDVGVIDGSEFDLGDGQGDYEEPPVHRFENESGGDPERPADGADQDGTDDGEDADQDAPVWDPSDDS